MADGFLLTPNVLPHPTGVFNYASSCLLIARSTSTTIPLFPFSTGAPRQIRFQLARRRSVSLSPQKISVN
jgi:hypothetical protein